MPWHRFPRVDGALAGLNAAQANEESFKADMRAQLREALSNAQINAAGSPRNKSHFSCKQIRPEAVHNLSPKNQLLRLRAPTIENGAPTRLDIIG
jgi:ABC-type transporter Mla subunit MlaD